MYQFNIEIPGPTVLPPGPELFEAAGPGGPWSKILLSIPGYGIIIFTHNNPLLT